MQLLQTAAEYVRYFRVTPAMERSASEMENFYKEYNPRDERAEHLLKISPYGEKVISELNDDPASLWEVIQDHCDKLDCGCRNRWKTTFIDLVLKMKSINEADLVKIPGLNWEKLSRRFPLSNETLQAHITEVDWGHITSSEEYGKDKEFIRLFGNLVNWGWDLKNVKVDLEKDWRKLLDDEKIFTVLSYALHHKVLEISEISKHLEYICRNCLSRLVSKYDVREYIDLKSDDVSNEDFLDFLRGHADLIISRCLPNQDWPKEILPIVMSPGMLDELRQWKEIMKSGEFDLGYYEEAVVPKAPSAFFEWLSGDKRYELPQDFVERHEDRLNWDELVQKQQLNPELFAKALTRVPFETICTSQSLSEDFIRANLDRIRLEDIAQHSQLSEAFVHDFRFKLDWFILCENQDMRSEFIEQHLDFINWGQISQFQNLSQDFILRYYNKLNHVKLRSNKHIKSLIEID